MTHTPPEPTPSPEAGPARDLERDAAAPSFTRRFDRLDDGLLAVAARWGATTAQRERERELLHEPVRELLAAGLGALRVPLELGGLGGSLVDLAERLVFIAAFDPNLAHVFRGHIGFVEGLHARSHEPYARAWLERAASGVLVGNAQSERAETAELGTVLTRSPGGLRLTGVKYYTTGSIYSDWIFLSALLDGERVGLVVDASQAGVESVDDWDGFGQPLTGSGTTTFTDVPVAEDHVFPDRHEEQDGVAEYVAGVFQLALLAVVAGIGRNALADTLAFVRPRRRIFGYTGEARPRDDAIAQLAVGHVSSLADAARRLVLSAAADLDAARDRDPRSRPHAFRAAAVDVFRVQQVVPRLVLDATTDLFEVGGASAVGRVHALDRHWRNTRTIFSHNPALQRERAIGEYELNGTLTTWGRVQVPADREDAR